MLESPSGLQIANFRRAGNVSARTRARRGMREGKERRISLPSPPRYTPVIARSRTRTTERTRRLEKKCDRGETRRYSSNYEKRLDSETARFVSENDSSFKTPRAPTSLKPSLGSSFFFTSVIFSVPMKSYGLKEGGSPASLRAIGKRHKLPTIRREGKSERKRLRAISPPRIQTSVVGGGGLTNRVRFREINRCRRAAVDAPDARIFLTERNTAVTRDNAGIYFPRPFWPFGAKRSEETREETPGREEL